MYVHVLIDSYYTVWLLFSKSELLNCCYMKNLTTSPVAIYIHSSNGACGKRSSLYWVLNFLHDSIIIRVLAKLLNCLTTLFQVEYSEPTIKRRVDLYLPSSEVYHVWWSFAVDIGSATACSHWSRHI